jgi:hypothetical protein
VLGVRRGKLFIITLSGIFMLSPLASAPDSSYGEMDETLNQGDESALQNYTPKFFLDMG